MSGIIPQDVIEQVRQASEIVDVVGQYVRLKKRGRNFLALCPFHTEKTASFSVSPDKQIYHCFGCGKGGNVFTFLMEHENMTFVEAIKFLAQKAGIRVPERKVDDRERELYERLHYAHQVALDYFKEMLFSDKYRDSVISYLHGKRILSDDSIEHFQLGLAGEEWDGFLKFALNKELFPAELVKAGLVGHSESKDKYYDRFRQRLMIPIFNLSGKPVAFGGRALKKGDVAKYINSPETPLYNKSNILYGLNFTRQFIREKNEVIIVEGYFDLIMLNQVGIKNVVASSGTAFTPQQARLLARFADMAYLFFDADSAGQQAAIRSVDALYDAGMEVLVMSPPDNEDPDTVARKNGAEGIDNIHQNARRYLEYRTMYERDQKKQHFSKEKLIKEFANLFRSIQDQTKRSLLIDEAADNLNVDQGKFYHLLSGPPQVQYGTEKLKSPQNITEQGRELISLILKHPEHFENVKKRIHFSDFQSESLGKIYNMAVKVYDEYGHVSPASLLDLIKDEELRAEISSPVRLDQYKIDTSVTINEYVIKLLEHKRKLRVVDLKFELGLAEKNHDEKSANRLREELKELITNPVK
jgi:DNA primase